MDWLRRAASLQSVLATNILAAVATVVRNLLAAVLAAVGVDLLTAVLATVGAATLKAAVRTLRRTQTTLRSTGLAGIVSGGRWRMKLSQRQQLRQMKLRQRQQLRQMTPVELRKWRKLRRARKRFSDGQFRQLLCRRLIACFSCRISNLGLQQMEPQK